MGLSVGGKAAEALLSLQQFLLCFEAMSTPRCVQCNPKPCQTIHVPMLACWLLSRSRLLTCACDAQPPQLPLQLLLLLAAALQLLPRLLSSTPAYHEAICMQ
jgi:hypothetical protein